MVGKKELVISNLYRYFYAERKLEEARLELEALDTSMGMKSPKLDKSPSGYSGTKDEKLLNYSIKKSEIDKEIRGWQSEVQTYYNVLHLYELDQLEIKFLSLMYKEKLSGQRIAEVMYFTNRQYVNRKRDTILERLARYM